MRQESSQERRAREEFYIVLHRILWRLEHWTPLSWLRRQREDVERINRSQG